MIIWIALAVNLIVRNLELLNSLPVWKGVLSTVVLIVLAPVFFLSDVGEYLLTVLIPEEE